MRSLFVSCLLSIHLLMPYMAYAQDKATKGPLDYTLKQYGLFLGTAVAGGLVAWFNKVRTGVLPAWSINALIGELVTAAFTGLICFWICEWAGFPQLLSAALTGIMGHMGTRGIAMFEEWASKKFGALVPPAPPQ